MNNRIVVVGAGFAGSVIARNIVEQTDYSVVLIEKRNHVAGNMYDEYVDGVLVQKYGPHFFITNEWWVMEYLKRFSDWYEYPIKAMSYVDGNYIDRPYNLRSIQQLLGPEKTGTLLKKIRSEFTSRRISLFDLQNSKDKEIQDLAKILRDNIYAPYVSKQWGKKIEDLDPLIIDRAQIVLGYDTQLVEYDYQYLPSEGYTKLFNNILEHDRIEVKLGKDATECLQIDQGGSEILYDGERVNAVVYTGAIDALFDYKYGVLPYRSRRFEYEKSDDKVLPYPGIITYPKNYDYIRQTEFAYFNPILDENTSIVQKEYSVSMEESEDKEPFYPIINDENGAMYNKYLDDANKVKNLYICGRLAEYKYYDMDAVIMRAFNVADEVIKTL